MIKNIRYSIVNGLFKDKASLKAIALLLFFYHRNGKNVLKNWSVNKLANVTGVHAYTIKKRIATLVDLGYAKVDGSSLVFLSVVSKHKNRNINISDICYDTIKDVEKSLYDTALLMVFSRIKHP